MVLGLPRRSKGEANRAVQPMTPVLLPLWKPLGDSAKAVQTAEKAPKHTVIANQPALWCGDPLQ